MASFPSGSSVMLLGRTPALRSEPAADSLLPARAQWPWLRLWLRLCVCRGARVAAALITDEGTGGHSAFWSSGSVGSAGDGAIAGAADVAVAGEAAEAPPKAGRPRLGGERVGHAC